MRTEKYLQQSSLPSNEDSSIVEAMTKDANAAVEAVLLSIMTNDPSQITLITLVSKGPRLPEVLD